MTLLTNMSLLCDVSCASFGVMCTFLDIVSGVVYTLGSVVLIFGSISTLCSDALSFGLTLLFIGDDSLGGGGGTLSFGNVGGIVLFNKVAISINTLLVSSPYVRLGILDYGHLILSRRSTATCPRYVPEVMAGKGICCGKIPLYPHFLLPHFLVYGIYNIYNVSC